MNTKNLMVFFLAIVGILGLVATVNAATTEIATVNSIKINDIYETGNEDISVTAGETIYVRVVFTALENASDVRMKLELEGTKTDVYSKTGPFDVEDGMRYSKTLAIKVPYELEDDVSDDIALRLKIWNGDYETEYPEITLRVQRETYKLGIMSIEADSTVNAGETIPVDVVLKNTGYNYLNDLYVTVKVPALNLEKKSYFGDLVALECTDEDGEYSCDESDEDSVRGRVYIKIPYDAKAGVYTIEVEAKNSDLTETAVKQINVQNRISNIAMRSGSDLILLNPTNNLNVYKVVSPSDETLVVVSAGSSKTIPVDVASQTNSEGKYNFDVNVFSGEDLVSTVNFSGSEKKTSVTSPVVALTIILAIVFLVLLMVLIVLLGKKPEKQEEFGESYY